MGKIASSRSTPIPSTTRAAVTAALITLCLLTVAPQTASADAPRPRVGISLAGGGFAGSVHGGYGGLQGRLGVQWLGFAMYVQSQGLVGGIGPDRGSDAVVGGLLNTLMFEATAGILRLGAGPGLDFFWGCSSPQHPNVCSTVGPYFSLDARLALQVLPFSISLDVHPTWLAKDEIATWMTLGVGLDF